MAGEKRSQDTEEPQRTENIILIDIEGTTTSISFVKETLFPYVREHLKEYIEKNWDNAEFKEDLEKLKEQAKKDETDKVEGLIPITSATPDEEKETLMKNIQWQMDNDRKSTALKQLQGHMWREAYKSGAVKGHVYEDVPKALEEWTSSGKKIYVYSSGSVEAQKLLFGHSTHGDLLKHFTDYFDTEVGAKQEASSYKTIATKIESETSKILFLTDIPNEAKAAIEAGLSSVLVVREGNEPLSADEKSKYTSIKSFLELSFQTAAKRQKLEEPPKEVPAKKEEEKKEEKKSEEAEDVEMKDVSDKKEKEEKKKDSDKTKTTEDKEAVKEVAEPEKLPEKSPVIDKEPEEKKQPDEPEKMEIEKEVKKDDEKEEKSDEKLTEIKEIKEIKETKTDDAKTDDKKIKTDEIKQDNETVNDVVDDKKVVEVEESKKVDDKQEKIDEKKEDKIEEKENGDQVKQNGDKSCETIEEKKIVKEINGESKKEDEVIKDDDKQEVKEIIEDEKKDKDDEKKEECEKKINGNTDNDETHRISDDTTKTTSNNKNGESSDDKESIKVKKVVDSIVDGAGETEVVTPVAVVAATS